MADKKTDTTKIIPEAEPVGDIAEAKADNGPKSYKVTKAAGNFVAGKRSPGAGKSITLSTEQAAYPLLNGEIEAA